MDKNRISIIIPVYNAEDYLDRCLESIVEQSFTSYEVILVDDGSTDSSPLICDRYSATDPRFRTIHKANGGVSSARNAGIDLAKGEYLLFVDSDDALLPDALERMMEHVAGEDMVLGGYASFVGGVPDKEVLPVKTKSYRGGEMALFFDENIRKNCEMLDAPWAKMFRRKAVGNMRFCEDLSYAEDKLFVFRFFSVCSSVHTCSVPVYAYHIRPGSLGSDQVSDRHLMQLRRFLPEYSQALATLAELYPASEKLRSLYHNEVIARYVCRILNIFLTRKTALLNDDYLGWVYGLMDQDASLGIFSVRPGQVFNLTLHRIGCIGLTKKVYGITSRINSLFHA
ncbi:MAG: glycosyltransferase family 2 protein [Bacteroidales bacterium]|nr:glycosyltransferase family 2 protein [Bacteroidales bacterium]